MAVKVAKAAKTKRREIPDHLWADLHREMARLHHAGWNLIPLLGNDDVVDENGRLLDMKKPVASFREKPLPLHVVWRIMRRHNSFMYGIRLPGMIVVDLDTMSIEGRSYLEWRFGRSTVVSQTKRGWHVWFKINEGTVVPPAIRQPKIAIDLKAGANSYVVGPKSVRPDGTVYEYQHGPLETPDDLPMFHDHLSGGHSAPKARKLADGRVAHGERHLYMRSRALEYTPVHDSLDDLVTNLLRLRDHEVQDPMTMPDDEIIDIATWCWGLRLKNAIWANRLSSFKVRRDAMQDILSCDHGCEAWALYSVLQAAHGHIPGRLFAISPEGMSGAGLLPLTVKPLRRARDTLVGSGFLIEVNRRKAFQGAHQYQLGRGGG